MPKETSIPVSRKTLEFLKEYKVEFGFSSLDKSVENAVRWARLFAYVDNEQRRSTEQRLSVLEIRLTALENFVKKLGEKKDV